MSIKVKNITACVRISGGDVTCLIACLSHIDEHAMTGHIWQTGLQYVIKPFVVYNNEGVE